MFLTSYTSQKHLQMLSIIRCFHLHNWRSVISEILPDITLRPIVLFDTSINWSSAWFLALATGPLFSPFTKWIIPNRSGSHTLEQLGNVFGFANITCSTTYSTYIKYIIITSSKNALQCVLNVFTGHYISLRWLATKAVGSWRFTYRMHCTFNWA